MCSRKSIHGPFTIVLHEAEAALARDTAQLANAKVALVRFQALVKDGLVTTQQLDDQQAQVNQFEAGLKGDQAQIENARLQLDYAHVRSPIDGVTGVRLVDPGNLVHPGGPDRSRGRDAARSMAVTFSLPQDDLVRVQRALAKGPLPVEVMNRDGADSFGSWDPRPRRQPSERGDRHGSTQSHHSESRAAALAESIREGALVGRDAASRAGRGLRGAIQRGPEGSFVYVVGAQNVAAVRSVEVSSTEEDSAIVAKGLSPGERVVVEGAKPAQAQREGRSARRSCWVRSGTGPLKHFSELFIRRPVATTLLMLGAPSGWHPRLPPAPRLGAARGRLPDDRRFHAAPWRQRRDGGFQRHDAARASIRANPGARAAHFGQ